MLDFVPEIRSRTLLSDARFGHAPLLAIHRWGDVPRGTSIR
jgi:hypothetical protein